MAVEQGSAVTGAFEVVPLGEQSTAPRRAPQEPASSIGDSRWYHRRVLGTVSPKHIISFSRQFASYLEAGVSLNRALESFRRQFNRTALGPVIGRLQLAVRRGDSLTDAMSREPAAFDRFYLSMMRVAEVQGSVPETLRMLSKQIDARQRLIRQTKSALIYPALVILMSICVATLLTILVLPPLVAVMQDIVQRRPIDLPWQTTYLIRFSDFIVHGGWWAIPAVLVGTVAAIIIAYQFPIGRAILDEVILATPVFGTLVWWIDTTRLCRTLATLLDAGVDIVSSLELTGETLISVPLRRAVLGARAGIMEGQTLSLCIEAANRFPEDIIAIINSGEETGRLPEMLQTVADEYEERVDFMVRDLGNLIQPLIIIVVGGVVFFVAIAFFMGYTSILQELGNLGSIS